MTHTTYAILSFALSSFAYIPYAYGVLRDMTRPTISTWISWILMDMAALAGMIAAGEIAWQVVAYIVGSSFVLSVSFYKRAALGWATFDTICVGIVLAAVAGWILSGNPDVAIVLSLIAAVVGSAPMAYSAMKDPRNELLLPWMFVLAGGICGVLAVTNWTIAGAGVPLVFAAVQVVFVLLIARKFFQPHRLRERLPVRD